MQLAPILDKIARLKSLAERPGTPEEAAAAMAAIQRLMLRYNLDEAQVRTAGRNDVTGFEKHRFDLGNDRRWRKNLLVSLTETHFCRAIFDWKGSGATIVGEEHNVAAVSGLFDYLTGEIIRLADEGWKAVKAGDDLVLPSARRWKNGFRHGATDTVGRRIREQFRDAQKDTEGSSALVVMKAEELNRAVAEFFPHLRSIGRRSSVSVSGYQAGQKAGARINLAAQIGAGA